MKTLPTSSLDFTFETWYLPNLCSLPRKNIKSEMDALLILSVVCVGVERGPLH